MKNSDTEELFEHFSPLVSTEEKSIHDNINLNRQSLEKGLRNRPNPNALIDRGILRNPGKAFSDKMTQLDLAKKRDKLKIKIANRPEREELERKLILKEQSDYRQKKLDRIKQRLDDSINNRPGSLELVGKNILQVDRLLASRIQSGEITYPKVCGIDGSFSDALSNHSTPLPPISEIDISNTLNELSGLQSLSSMSGSKPSIRNSQFTTKKTYRVGRYSFHNIEFRPAAQKAREYQQNQLVQFEEMQAQRNPNLKKLHSELAIKSHHNTELNSTDIVNFTSSKPSLLHRLNVHELKSECKIRMISCSNIPKVQLVEKLLPYESEILASHTSFDLSNRNFTPNSQSNRRSMPVMKCTRDFSPPENNNYNNVCGSLYTSSQNSGPTPNSIYVSQNCSKLCHSHSEPLIPNYISSPQSGSSFINGIQFFPIANNADGNSNLTYVNINGDGNYRNQIPINNFNANNSYPSLNYQQPNLSMDMNSYPMKEHNMLVQSNIFESDNINNWTDSQKPSQDMGLMTTNLNHLYNDNFTHHHPCTEIISTNTITINDEVKLTPFYLPTDGHNYQQPTNVHYDTKMEIIKKEVTKLFYFTEKIKSITLQNPNIVLLNYMEQLAMNKSNTIKLIKEMIEFINDEFNCKKIDMTSAQSQKHWLDNLLFAVDNDFHLNNAKYVKIENDFSELHRKSDDLMNNNNNGIRSTCHTNKMDDVEILNFDSMNTSSIRRLNDCFILESLNDEICKDEDMDQFSFNELMIPDASPIDIVNSPIYDHEFAIDDMYDILNLNENVMS